jgi:hypothetical protein
LFQSAKLVTQTKNKKKARTLTLSKMTWQVLEALIPSLFSFLPMLRPGVPASTMKVVIPR